MNPAVLVGIGFLAGTAGVKAITSKPVRKACVKGLVQGMKAKEQCETLIEEAKAEFDDIMAEAEYELDEPAEEDELDVEPKADEPKKTKGTKRAKAAEA